MSDIVGAGTVFIREETLLPAAFLLESASFARGWRIVQNVDAQGLSRKIQQAHWNFFCLAGEINASVFGFDEHKMIHRAAVQILADAKTQEFNVLEITRVSAVSSRRFLGVHHATVSGSARHIQQSVFLSGGNELVERKPATIAPAGNWAHS